MKFLYCAGAESLDDFALFFHKEEDRSSFRNRQNSWSFQLKRESMGSIFFSVMMTMLFFRRVPVTRCLPTQLTPCCPFFLNENSHQDACRSMRLLLLCGFLG